MWPDKAMSIGCQMGSGGVRLFAIKHLGDRLTLVAFNWSRVRQLPGLP
jgi:hypothetical protein